MAKGKSLSGILKGGGPSSIGLTRRNHHHETLHPFAGQSRELTQSEIEAAPLSSDDEQIHVDNDYDLSNDAGAPVQSIRPKVVDRKRKSDRVKSRTHPDSVNSEATPLNKSEVKEAVGDIFGQGNLHGSRGNKRRSSQMLSSSQTYKRSHITQELTSNIHSEVTVKAGDDGKGSLSPFSRSSQPMNKFKRPSPKRSASPASDSSQSKRPSFRLPVQREKKMKESDGSSIGSVESDPPKLKLPRSTKPAPAFTRPSAPRPTSQTDRDALKDVSACPPNSQIRDQLSTAAGKLNVIGNAEVDGLLDTFKKPSSIPILFDDKSKSALDDMDLPDMHLVISSSASLPPLSCTSVENHPHSSEPTAQIDLTETGETLCPFCKDAIDKAWLEERAPPGRLSIRQQAELCKAHKVHSAHDKWREKDYPEIDWTNFNVRLDGYHDRIEKLLDNSQSSFYRNVLEDKVRKGKNRTLRQALIQGDGMEGLVPGYYGTRGGKLIVDNIITRFSTKLRRLDRFDKLISAAGTSGYVQAVLAPEMAVMLVMDDMKTGEEGAREILRESVDIGNLLNEEEDETLI